MLTIKNTFYDVFISAFFSIINYIIRNVGKVAHVSFVPCLRLSTAEYKNNCMNYWVFIVVKVTFIIIMVSSISVKVCCEGSDNRNDKMGMTAMEII